MKNKRLVTCVERQKTRGREGKVPPQKLPKDGVRSRVKPPFSYLGAGKALKPVLAVAPNGAHWFGGCCSSHPKSALKF